MNIATELTPEERDKLIDELATKIVNKRMETPAILFLEMHKPVAFIASQAAMVASPFLVPLFGKDGVEKYSKLFSSAENVELIIQRIEDLVEERKQKAGESVKSEEANKE